MIPASALIPITVSTTVCLLSVLSGLGLLIRGFLLLLENGKTKTAPPLKIDQAAVGLAEVSGRASGPYTITAPITSKPCYLYRTTVWQEPRNWQPDAWEKVVDETLHVPFFLEDSTGQLLIEPMGADLDVPVSLRAVYGGSMFFDPNAVVPAVNLFLARHGVAPTSRILIEERCIEPQSEVFVTGTITENPGIEVGPLFRKKDERRPNAAKGIEFGGDGPEIIQLSSPSVSLTSGIMTQQSRIAAALNKAGIQNPNAWAAAGVPYSEHDAANATAVLSEETASVGKDAPQEKLQLQSGFDLKPARVLMKGPDDAPFVFCSHHTQLPARTSNWKPLAMLSAGTVLASAGFCVFLLKMFGL